MSGVPLVPFKTLVALSVLVVSVGCDTNPTALRPDGGASVPADPVYFYEDVRPILAENCVGCHGPGGIAPFELTAYDDAVEVGERMAEVTRDRIMPPYIVDNSGECNHYIDARGLEQAEIDLIGDWVRGGMLEGDPTTSAPPVAQLPTLEVVDSTLDMGAEYAPRSAEDDDYRCFVVEPDWTGDQFLTGADVRPGNPEIVHHMIVFAPVDAAEGAAARALDGSDGRPGYTCFGDAVVFALPVIVWAPGVGAQHFPERTGIRLDGDVPLIMQVHYNLTADDGVPDRTRVDLELADSVEDEAWMGLVADFGLNLPPRMESTSNDYQGGIAFAPDGPLRVHAAYPHMHTLGRSMRVEAMDAGNTCMVDVPRWDFNWQGGFFYETPIDLDAGQFMRLRCDYDTRERDSATV